MSEIQRFKCQSGSIRHDIANQLSVVVGYTELLECECKDPKSNQAQALKKIGLAADRIKHKLEDWKKYEDVWLSPDWQLFTKAYNSCEKPLNIIINVEDEMCKISLYSTPMLSIVWENLLDNSVRHGGASEAKIYHQIRGDKLVVFYEDNGKGIPLEEKEMIFKEGFGKNTGMGMFYTMEILKDTGIEISEVGELGKGAKFEILIPKNGYKIE